MGRLVLNRVVDRTETLAARPATSPLSPRAEAELVESFKVDLDQPVHRYLPEFTMADRRSQERTTFSRAHPRWFTAGGHGVVTTADDLSQWLIAQNNRG
ncbi:MULTISPECIES: hypothetical protein [unclassified Streptomyces]|uniref:hypothetical protein n=1 Tax=unclassified Streptomyces TaxID=2593676 RepID=UPI002365A570|nr:MULTISPECIES: hypothetical protein [unclassified Streptomyces]MDF3141907.1 hypothetical protein [Streptomyces sp. T21Q-yed]WDF39929.1 hypothetical protein PBV52_25625 [Streptomyces sp. T12]